MHRQPFCRRFRFCALQVSTSTPHAVYGLKQLGLTFELKGGTSLSKGFGIIERFSEDIDIRIEPFDGLQVDTNPNHERPTHIESRRMFYEKLRDKIKIPGITTVERDTTYDDEKLQKPRPQVKSQNPLCFIP